MTIVVEDGSIVTGANSYVTEAELTAYATARGVTLSGDTEELLIRAMDYTENLSFRGVKVSSDQPLQWPRGYVVVDGYGIDSDEIPDLLKNGQMQVAMAIDNGQDPLADVPRQKVSATVGAISVTYAQGQATTLVRKIMSQFRKLVKSSSSGISFTVDRG